MIAAGAYYLPPTLAMAALPYGIALLILTTRFSEILRGERPVSFFEDFDGFGASVAVMRPTRQLANLFEFPTLFYAASAIVIGCGLRDLWLLRLCWSYAALRWMHAGSHIFVNRLWIRTPVFAASNLLLLSLWIRMSFLIFS